MIHRGECSIQPVKQEGKLDLSWDGFFSAITIALMSRQQQDTVLEKYETYKVPTEQIQYMNLAHELGDKGSFKTRDMTRWLADNPPQTGISLADLRNNRHGSGIQSWQPWHTENFRMLLELLSREVGFKNQERPATSH